MTHGRGILTFLLVALVFVAWAFLSVGSVHGITAPEEEWNRTFGGSSNDFGNAVQQTTDGGYIVAGSTGSFGAGSPNVWLIKVAANGTEEWNSTFGGGSPTEPGESVQQTTDGGYIVAGRSFGVGNLDVWLLKVAANGTAEWNRTFGGYSYDLGYAVQQTTDGGYIVVGSTKSFGAGYADVWLLKVAANGTAEWNRTFGGSYDDVGHSVQQTTDGGYIIAGSTQSFGEGSMGSADVWLLKVAANGTAEWNRTFSRSSGDSGHSVQQTIDGGYIVAGSTNSPVAGSPHVESSDVWLLKVAANGMAEWNRTFGGSYQDEGYSVQQTTDGGYIIAGTTGSFGAGSADVWLIKLKAENLPPTAIINSITPNPAKQGRDTVSFIGYGNDSDGYIVAYKWASSIDGLLNTSPSFTKPASELSVGTHIIYFGVQDDYGAWSSGDTENLTIKAANQPPVASFTYLPEIPRINEPVTFNASSSLDPDGNITSYNWSFGDGNAIITTEVLVAHSYGSVGDYTVDLTLTDNEGATNRTSKTIKVLSNISYFDTEPGTYPSISGTHNGTIKMTHTVNVSKIYLYPCAGTGGHIKYARIWNASWNGAEARWDGYVDDWHNLSFDKNFTLVAGETYNYTIRTGSYPQIHHTPELLTAKGWITCSSFVDINGKRHEGWIPAIRLS